MIDAYILHLPLIFLRFKASESVLPTQFLHCMSRHQMAPISAVGGAYTWSVNVISAGCYVFPNESKIICIFYTFVGIAYHLHTLYRASSLAVYNIAKINF